MINWQEIVCLERFDNLPKELGLVQRTESEIARIAGVALEHAGGDARAAKILLDQALLLIHFDRTWGRSLFLGTAAGLVPLIEVLKLLDWLALAKKEDLAGQTLEIAVRGALREPHYLDLYLAMVEELAGKKTLEALEDRLRLYSAGNPVASRLNDNGRALYKEAAGRSVWSYTHRVLTSLHARVIDFRSNLRREVKTGNGYPMMVAMLGEVEEEAALLEAVLKLRAATP